MNRIGGMEDIDVEQIFLEQPCEDRLHQTFCFLDVRSVTLHTGIMSFCEG